MLTKRIFITIVLIGAVLYAPWWLALVSALCAVFYFPAYYEVVALGIVLDLLYGTGYGAWGFLAGVVIFFSIERIKRELR